MNFKSKLIALLLLGFSSFVCAESITKTLQNGLDGYDGCVDATISYQMYDQLDPSDDALNHEGGTTLKLKSCLS